MKLQLLCNRRLQVELQQTDQLIRVHIYDAVRSTDLSRCRARSILMLLYQIWVHLFWTSKLRMKSQPTKKCQEVLN